MACRTCHNALRPIPAVYPTWWCGMCGTLLEATDEGPRWSVPAIQTSLRDAGDSCLRDDRRQCCVFAAARAATGERGPYEPEREEHDR